MKGKSVKRCAAFAFFLCLAVFSNACYSKGQNAEAARLSSELFQLATSKDPHGFAEKRGIHLVGDFVRVIIITKKDSAAFAGRYGVNIIKSRRKTHEADVPIKNLISLSKEEEIERIRRPYKFWMLQP
jgi:hypothetical protein